MARRWSKYTLDGDLMRSSLFDSGVQAPLPDRLRPRDLDQVVGQDHLLGLDGPLRRMVSARRLSSFILWGPPGVGKTTIARLIAGEANYAFVQLSAVLSGVADLRREIDGARNLLAGAGKQTVMFIDELHRFNRNTQDAMLPHVEAGTVVLIGATTENPSFSLVAALLSRAKVYTLNALDGKAAETLLKRAEAEEKRKLPLDDDARQALIRMADGDGRYLLSLCEDLFLIDAEGAMTPELLATAVQRRAPIYDKGQENHFNLLSCFHKSLRGSDVHAALYWAARMVIGGEDPNVIFRRLACVASEDVGLADPQALVQVMAAWRAFERVGMPEGRLFMAQAVIFVATAPKSNAAYVAFNEAFALAKNEGSAPPPKSILNAPTKLMEELGYHDGYKYDHDQPDAFSGQEFMPETLAGENRPEFYRPNERGFEREVKKRLKFWRRRRSELQEQKGPPSG